MPPKHPRLERSGSELLLLLCCLSQPTPSRRVIFMIIWGMPLCPSRTLRVADRQHETHESAKRLPRLAADPYILPTIQRTSGSDDKPHPCPVGMQEYAARGPIGATRLADRREKFDPLAFVWLTHLWGLSSPLCVGPAALGCQRGTPHPQRCTTAANSIGVPLPIVAACLQHKETATMALAPTWTLGRCPRRGPGSFSGATAPTGMTFLASSAEVILASNS